jgi:nitrogen regulatory protein P-II 2
MTVTGSRAMGVRKATLDLPRRRYAVSFSPKIKIDGGPFDRSTRPSTPSRLRPRPARSATGIFILGLDNAVRIRTGETDAAAL